MITAIDFGVECAVMRRVHGASAQTSLHGHRVSSSWSWREAKFKLGDDTTNIIHGGSAIIIQSSDGGNDVDVGGGGLLEYNATVPIGFRSTLTLPKECGGLHLAVVAEGTRGAVADVWRAGMRAGPPQDDMTLVNGVGVHDGNGGDVVKVGLASGVYRVVATYE